MFTSVKYSNLVLRLGLAAVFLWFGADKFLQPNYWLNAWLPAWFLNVIGNLGVSPIQFIYLNGIFEVLVGLSLITGIFMKFFSALAALFLVVVLISVGISEVTIRDIGLIGGLVSILFWPDQRHRF